MPFQTSNKEAKYGHILISVVFALPVVVLVSAQNKKAVPIILTMAAILGTLIGVAGHFLK